MTSKVPVSYMILGLAAVLSGAAMFVISFLVIAAGAGLLAGAGSKQVGVMWAFTGSKYLFSGIFFVVTGLALINMKRWARYCMFLAAAILFMMFREAILGSLLYTICFVNLLLAILYLFKEF